MSPPDRPRATRSNQEIPRLTQDVRRSTQEWLKSSPESSSGRMREAAGPAGDRLTSCQDRSWETPSARYRAPRHPSLQPGCALAPGNARQRPRRKNVERRQDLTNKLQDLPLTAEYTGSKQAGGTNWPDKTTQGS